MIVWPAGSIRAAPGAGTSGRPTWVACWLEVLRAGFHARSAQGRGADAGCRGAAALRAGVIGAGICCGSSSAPRRSRGTCSASSCAFEVAGRGDEHRCGAGDFSVFHRRRRRRDHRLVVVFRLTRYVSAGSIVGSLAFPVAYASIGAADGWPITGAQLSAAGLRDPDGAADHL